MFLLFAQAAAAAPVDAAPAVEATPWYTEMLSYGAIHYLVDGGIFMWPILLCGILAAAVIIERFRSLQFLATDTHQLRQQVLELLQAGKAEEALEVCSQSQGPVPAVLAAGLRKYVVLQKLNYDPGQIEQQVVKAMEDYAVHIVAALEKHLPVLATVASVAPMIGFLGTVQGMVISFQDIVAKLGEENIVKAAADGIQVALLTTVFGLVVGIPAFTGFNYFTSIINRYVLEIEETASELIEAVTLYTAIHYQAPTASSTVRPQGARS
ncbi:MAG: MotA/TolQ/ExbB proton channel family protein [Bacteroidales bacterium]|nr:MotA/TolQ/ExbB proton channel family protein [Bacteroidales bacterium]